MTSSTSLHPVAGCEDANRAADIVFVHGLDGDPIGTWASSPTVFWPQLLGEDLREVGIWSLGYPAASSDWVGTSMPLADRAITVLSLLEAKGLGVRPIFFIAHSLGGLLVKQMLRHAIEMNQVSWLAIVRSIRGIIFIATPNSGSRIANWISYLRSLRSSAAAKDLQDNDSRLRELNTWFRNRIHELGCRILVFCEKRPVGPIIVVDETSADPGIPGVIPIPLDDNHITICKPNSRDALLYLQIKKFVSDLLPLGIKAAPELPTASDVSTESSVGISVLDIGGWRPNEINCISWSPSSRFIAAASDDRTIRVWRPLGKDLIISICAHTAPVKSVCWAPDESSIVSASSDGDVKVWSFPSGSLLHNWSGANDWARSVAWSGDGSFIAAGYADGTVKVLDPSGGKEIYCLKGHTGRVRAVVFSPSSKFVASGATDCSVRVWDHQSRQLIAGISTEALFQGSDRQLAQVISLAWSPSDNYIAAGTVSGYVILIDTVAWRIAKAAKVCVDSVLSISWSPDGNELISGSADRTLKRCRVKEFGKWGILEKLTRYVPRHSTIGDQITTHLGSVRSVAWSPDGSHLASGSTDQFIRVQSPEESIELSPHSLRIRCASCSPAGRYLALGTIGRTVLVFDMDSRTLVWSFEGTSDVFESLASGKDDRMKEKRREGLDEYINCIAWSPDSKYLAVGSDDRTVRLINVQTGKADSRTLVEPHTTSIRCIAWSPFGDEIVSCSAGSVVLWNISTGKHQCVRAHHGDALAVCWSPVSHIFATVGEDKKINIWSGSTCKSLTDTATEISQLSWSRDGKFIAGGGVAPVFTVWDAIFGRPVAELPVNGGVRSIDWDSSNKYCAISTEEGNVCLISVGDWKVVAERRSLPYTHRSLGLFFRNIPAPVHDELTSELFLSLSEFPQCAPSEPLRLP